MKVLTDTIKFRRDRVTATVEIDGEKHDVEMGDMEEILGSIVRQCNELFRKLKTAINLNESRFNTIIGDDGTGPEDYLPVVGVGWPNAPPELHGTFYLFRTPTAAERLYYCRRWSVFVTTWTQINIP